MSYGRCFYDVYYGTVKKRWAENRHLPPIFFYQFLAELHIFKSFESNLTFALTLVIFWLKIKYFEIKMQK